MAGLFDDLIPADPSAAPPLTVQGPGNVQAAPVAAAGPVDPNAQGAPAQAAAADPNSPQTGLFDDLIPQDPGILQHVLNAASRVPGNLSDKLNNIADGIPFSDRARAAVQAATGLGGTFGDYSGDLAATQAAAAQRMQSNPASAIMGQVLGGSMLPIGAVGEAAQGATVGAKVLGGAAAGTGVGALYGASASPDLGNLPATAATTAAGGALGALTGGAIPAAGAGLGKAASGLFGQAVPAVTGPSGIIGRPAQKFVMDAIQADGPGAISQGVNQLGPNGMLADYGNSLRGMAQALVTKPGEAGQNIVQSLDARNAGVNDRLGQVVQQNLGPVTSPATHAADVNAAIAPYAQAQQQALAAAGPVDVSGPFMGIHQAMQNVAPGSPEYDALNQARTMLTAPDGSAINARQVYSARQALDDLIDYDGPAAVPSSAIRSQQGALQNVRGQLDNTLRTQVPGYADATDAIAAQAPRRDAYAAGLDDLTRDVSHHPGDYQQTFNGLAPQVQNSRAAGLRMAVEQGTGTKENDLQALRNVTQGANGWNAQNLGTVFGQAPVDNVNQAIAAELRMRDTYGKVTQGSESARRLAMAKALADKETEPFQLENMHNVTKEGIVLGTAAKIINPLLRAVQPQVDNGARDAQIADTLTAQGDARNRLLVQLLQSHRAQDANSAIAGPASGYGAALAAATPAALAAALRAHRQPSR